ncbi:hypothetical protein DOY81_010937 [Sarcophaga bullata]|nr:hypothetical protein DOY81_010937 [Sarcophaga bullata]
MLSCCLDVAFTKIAYEKTVEFKGKSFVKNKKVLQTNSSSNLDSIANEIGNDYFNTTSSSVTKSTSPTEDTTSFELTSHHDTTVATTVDKSSVNKLSHEDVSCTCGIFLSSQFVKGSSAPPKGEPVIANTLDRQFVCNPIGRKQCQTKCLEQIVKHLPDSSSILCASLDRDIRKERAYLFIRNCSLRWHNTNLADGREYCCKNGLPYACPKK